MYDCGGRAHPESFTDVGLRMTHKFEGPFRIGVGATYVKDKSGGGLVPYPDLALDFRYFALGTTGIRVGAEDEVYGELSVLDQVPALSGKGFVRIGLGFRPPGGNTRFWFGENTIPYSKGGFAGQVDFPVSANTFLFVNGRVGDSGGITEYGLSLGVRVRNW